MHLVKELHKNIKNYLFKYDIVIIRLEFNIYNY